ncbi:MAG: GNAT family N-acetyltransferase [Acidobacteriota bacterium]|nr:GNAT family N-acetyltransferase [Acidobacteriota bacterium]
MGLNIRAYREGDEEAMLRLWVEHGGFDSVDMDVWRDRFLNNPVGPSHMIVAEDDAKGEIVAQLISVPSVIWFEGERISAARPFAPIISKDVRAQFLTVNPLNHPIVKMYRKSNDLLEERGVRLSYMLPDPSWQLLYKLLPTRKLQIKKFPLWSRKLPLAQPIDLGDGVTVGPIESDDLRIDELGRAVSTKYNCMIVRDHINMPWKLMHWNYEIIGVERDGKLIGMAASLNKGHRQWLICDVLTVDMDDSLRTTLAAVTNLAHEKSSDSPSGEPIDKVGLLTPPLMEPALASLGYERDDYEFMFVVRAIDSSLDKSKVAPENWYVAAND